MKCHRLYLLPGLVIIILFQHCTTTRYYYQDMQYFTEIPLRDQKQDYTMVYFPDDLKPERPYIEAGVVRLSVRGHRKTQQLVPQLRAKARALGLDAVIETQRLSEGSRGANFGEALTLGAIDGAVNGIVGLESGGDSSMDSYETYSHSVLEGIGIKYLDNIHNIEKSVKSEKVYFASKPNELLYHKQYFLNGETKSIDFDDQQAIYIHDNFVEAFSLHHLINQETNWKYQIHDNMLLKREYYKAVDWKLKTCKFIYDFGQGNSLKKIVVRYPGQEKKEVLRLYSKFDQVEMKEIFQNGALAYREKLMHDDKNRLVARKIFKIKDKAETLWLVVQYDFYQNSELKKYLDKADSKSDNG